MFIAERALRVDTLVQSQAADVRIMRLLVASKRAHPAPPLASNYVWTRLWQTAPQLPQQ